MLHGSVIRFQGSHISDLPIDSVGVARVYDTSTHQKLAIRISKSFHDKRKLKRFSYASSILMLQLFHYKIKAVPSFVIELRNAMAGVAGKLITSDRGS